MEAASSPETTRFGKLSDWFKEDSQSTEEDVTRILADDGGDFPLSGDGLLLDDVGVGGD